MKIIDVTVCPLNKNNDIEKVGEILIDFNDEFRTNLKKLTAKHKGLPINDHNLRYIAEEVNSLLYECIVNK